MEIKRAGGHSVICSLFLGLTSDNYSKPGSARDTPMQYMDLYH